MLVVCSLAKLIFSFKEITHVHKIKRLFWFKFNFKAKCCLFEKV